MLWKKTQNTISNVLNSFDKFEEPIQLNLKGESSSTSTLGGAISLLIMIFLSYQAIKQTLVMFNRDSLQVVQMSEFQNEPSVIYLNKTNNFNLMISTRMGGDFVNMSSSSLISFNTVLFEQNQDDDGNTSMRASQILWAPCNRSDFPSSVFSGNIFDTYYLDYAYCATGINYTNISDGLCPSEILKDHPDCVTPPEFNLEGTMFSKRFSFINIFFTLCNPFDARNIYGLQCSPNPLNDTLAAGGLTTYLGFSNTYIDPSNFNSPNQTFFDYMEWNLHPMISKMANIYVDKEIVEDYDSFIWTDSSHDNSFYSISPDKMREQDLTPQNFLLQASLLRSKLNKITTRTYVTVFDVMSNVGGLSEPLFLIGSLLALGYARCKYLTLLSNELYDFEQHQQTIALRKVALDSFRINTNRGFSTKGGGKINMKEYFDALRAKNKIEYGEITYMKNLFRGLFRKPNPKEQLVQKAKKKAIKDLDLAKLIDKVKEIDKLKMLLLNQNQLEAFKLIKKPKITLRDKRGYQKGNISNISPRSQGEESKTAAILETEGSKYERLYSAYRQLKEDKNAENVRLNERLLNMLDKDILNVFNQIEGHSSPVSESHQFEHVLQEIHDKSTKLNVVDL